VSNTCNWSTGSGSTLLLNNDSAGVGGGGGVLPSNYSHQQYLHSHSNTLLIVSKNSDSVADGTKKLNYNTTIIFTKPPMSLKSFKLLNY